MRNFSARVNKQRKQKNMDNAEIKTNEYARLMRLEISQKVYAVFRDLDINADNLLSVEECRLDRIVFSKDGIFCHVRRFGNPSREVVLPQENVYCTSSGAIFRALEVNGNLPQTENAREGNCDE